MDLNVDGNPGSGNTFQQYDIQSAGSVNPNATTAITNVFGSAGGPTRMNAYFQKLLDEIKGNVTDKVIDELLYYTTRLDGTKGMEEKLVDGGFKSSKIAEAKRRKELYAKKAMQYDCYPSAQHINLTLFSRIKNDFDTYIYPLIERGEELTLVMQQIHERIVTPIMTLLENNGAFDLHLRYTHDHIYGMIYYLTGMCHLNWKDYDNV